MKFNNILNEQWSKAKSDAIPKRSGSQTSDVIPKKSDSIPKKSDSIPKKNDSGGTNQANSDVFACLLNYTGNVKIVKTSSPTQLKQVFSKATHFYFSNYYFLIQDKDGKTVTFRGTWKCDGDKDYIVNTDDGDEFSSKDDKWKGIPDPNTNTNNNNSNNPGLVNTTLTGDELKAGKIVKRGMKGDIVGQIQDLLIKLGYINVSKDNKTDKIFGSRTEKMVKDFQTANKLSDDGQVGKETWPKLNDPAAVKNSASSISGSMGGAQAEVPKDGETTAGSDVIIKESLKIKLRKNLLKFN